MIWRTTIFPILFLLLCWSYASPHDHVHPELNFWFRSLHSSGGAWCCDGSEALHLRDVDWETQNFERSHYRVRIPKDSAAYDHAMMGEDVETIWVDVPDTSVITDPNKDGSTLVWPTYGTTGTTVRCFLPGLMG
jgi:hypothetical protein